DAVPLALCFANPISGSSILIWAEMYRRVGRFLSPYRNVDSDCNYWMRAFEQGYRGRPSGQAGAILYRVHEGQTSANTHAMSMGAAVCRLAALKRHVQTPRSSDEQIRKVLWAVLRD